MRRKSQPYGLIINLERVLNRYVFRCENDFNGRSEDI